MTIQELKQQAELVRNATQIGENTAERVGGVMVETVRHIEQQEYAIEALKQRNLNEIPAYNGVVNSATVQDNGVMSYTGVFYVASAGVFAAKSGTSYYNVWAKTANYPSNEAYNQDGKAIANRLYNSLALDGGLHYFDGTTFRKVNDNSGVEESITILQQTIQDLTARIEELEKGGGGGGSSTDVEDGTLSASASVVNEVMSVQGSVVNGVLKL